MATARRRLSPEDRRAELLALGAEVFGKRPYDEVRIDEIAERARISGAPIMSGPVTTDTLRYGEASGNPVRTLLVRDPDGNVIQFDQRQSPPS